MTRRKIYLAGPMRGLPNFNFPAFMAATKQLRKEGWDVFSPAEEDNKRTGTDVSKDSPIGDDTILSEKYGFDWRRTALSVDLKFICLEANAIAMLPGWETSKGAIAEISTARALGLEIIFLGDKYAPK